MDLVRAVLREHCRDDQSARQFLSDALYLEADPFEYFAHRFGIDPAEVMRRAAAWAGLAFAPAPVLHIDDLTGLDVEALGRARLVPGRPRGRRMIYAAPGFAEILRLKVKADQETEYRRRTCLVPRPALRRALSVTLAAPLIELARQRLIRTWPRANAALNVTMRRRGAFIAGAIGLVMLAGYAHFSADRWLLWPVDGLLLVPGALRLAALLSMVRRPGRARAVPLLDDPDLPTYSVLIPLRDEARMVPQLRTAMSRLDYPPEKLDIKFIVESQSRTTIEAVEAILGDPRFELIVVPAAAPLTKPKALDFALPFAIGEHVVVFDAEDIPDRGQLRLAASRFAAEPDLECLQAELVLDNAEESLLTALFSGEYAAQFGVLLPALARWGLPMPLGGTSNHFRTKTLAGIGAWDAFNVTEDADLGVRLARCGLRTDVLASRTREEAPVSMKAWIAQRTRWMKGWMQTLIVHGHAPSEFRSQVGWPGFAAFHLYVCSMLVSAPLHTLFAVSLGVRVLGRRQLDLDVIDWLVAGIGYGSALAVVTVGLWRLRALRLIAAQLLLPAYWFLFTIALWRAGWGLMKSPQFWAKTQHGRTQMARDARITPKPPGGPMRRLLERLRSPEPSE